ncbi:MULTISPECIES: biotin--[acetyl-CoA-carboxylase] ligase [Acidiphilium]|uniref:Biotin--[acetyl-CoA-carboxylase] ligase n=1 Tax=Acidiphilium iwatense TaxID=768198 RepID=A0ABS9DZ49_9PROT|nr:MULTISPECIES: biotin--[acetyl-CoA-carboxylase] ligase [Acidiphilium]MCF3947065.1 biotin--[acetyl-CoA-carboxylase] ligase [Acidiphilium iwatense]
MTSPLSWRIERYEALASTSDLCVDRALAGEPDRLMVIAARQNAGRGRAGRAWSSPEGNFYGSVLLRPGAPANSGGSFALLAGLSLLEAFAGFLPDASRLVLKWPNDIMAGQAKLAGVLLDAAIEADRITWLVIGFGVNLVAAPAVPGRLTTNLAALGCITSPDRLAEKLCSRIDHWQASLAADGGAALRLAWTAWAHPPGTAITVDGGRICGIYEGIDAEGSLLLRNGGTVTAIRSGDVALL